MPGLGHALKGATDSLDYILVLHSRISALDVSDDRRTLGAGFGTSLFPTNGFWDKHIVWPLPGTKTGDWNRPCYTHHPWGAVG